MAGVRVVTDSSCDLPPEVCAEHGIRVVPLTIRFGSEEFVDRRDLSTDQFWQRCAVSPVLPETAAPAPGAFEAAFREAAAEGADGVLCLCLSSKLSATMQAAQVAAQAVDVPVRVVDSLGVSMSLGVQVVAACELAEAGKGLDDIVGAAEEMATRVHLVAMLDTLENLRKGGRIGGAQAFIGSMLSLKPIVSVVDGEVVAESKQRTRSRAMRYLVDYVGRTTPDIERLYVMHAAAPDVDLFVEQVREIYPRDDIVVGDIGAVIGTHSGVGALGVGWVAART